jgi:CBS-domain-containing membrane protein
MTAVTTTELRYVGDAMITQPTIHGSAATVGELRTFFDDDHVHMALLVDAGTLVGVVDRADLRPELSDDMPARAIAALDGKTVRPDAALVDVFAAMSQGARRRLAVTTESSVLLGLLCLKASGFGFCTDAGVRRRKSRRAD